MQDEFNLDDFSQPKWFGTSAIPLIDQLNKQCVEVLCEWAATPAFKAPPLVTDNRELWRHLYPQAKKRLATFPFVLVNVRFNDEAWWLQACEKSAVISISGIPSKLTDNLILEALLFARQVAREDHNVAKVTFGMTTPVATCISKLHLPQVRAIALNNVEALEVFAADDSSLWRDLLLAARDNNEAELVALRHHAKRRFCGNANAPSS
jgi:hypothetical protein